MNIRTFTAAAASLVVISGIVTGNLWRELRAEQAATSALRDELAGSQRRIKAAEDALAAAAARVAAATAVPAAVPAPEPAPEKKSASPASPPPVAAGVVVFSSGTGGTVRISEQDLMKDPEYRKARLAMMRTTIRQTYPGLAEELGLNPDEADQLFELLAQNQMEQQAQMTSVLGTNGQVDQAAMERSSRIRQSLQRQLNESLQNMLGDARYGQWQDYQQTRTQRMQANNYATQLAQAGVPMSASQNKAMVQVLIAEQRNLQADTVQLSRMVDPSNPATRAEAQKALADRRVQSNQHILDAAAGTLTPQQINVLREQFEQQEAINRAQERVRERTQGMAPF